MRKSFLEALVNTTVWVNLAAERQDKALMLWMKLQAAPWFAGLLSGDRHGCLGISVWGPVLVCSEIRGKIAAKLGTDIQLLKRIGRVYGYGLSFGLNACEESCYAL